MRFSFITTVLALSLTVSASQLDRRELDQVATKCFVQMKAVSDYLPIFTKSIQKITSYSSVIEAHIKEDNVEKKIRKALKECKKITNVSSEITVAFTDILKPLVRNIQKISDALVEKKYDIDSISLARPLLEDSLRTISKDTMDLKDMLINVCPKESMEGFKGYVDDITNAFKKMFNAFSIEE